jgi:hypothetical protein
MAYETCFWLTRYGSEVLERMKVYTAFLHMTATVG